MQRSDMTSLFDHVVGTNEYRSWDGEAKCLSGLEVDRQLELRRLHHRQIGGLLTLEDARDVTTHQMIGLGEIGSAAGEAAGSGEIAAAVNRWHRMPVRYGDGRTWLLPDLRKPSDGEIGTASGYPRLAGGKLGRPIDLPPDDGRLHLQRAAMGSYGSQGAKAYARPAAVICRNESSASSCHSRRADRRIFA